jgi:hypothetical protein
MDGYEVRNGWMCHANGGSKISPVESLNLELWTWEEIQKYEPFGESIDTFLEKHNIELPPKVDCRHFDSGVCCIDGDECDHDRPKRYVIVVGTPFDGFVMHGPFPSIEAADEYADINLKGEEWWLDSMLLIERERGTP